MNGEIHNVYNLHNITNIVKIVLRGNFTKSMEERNNSSAGKPRKHCIIKVKALVNTRRLIGEKYIEGRGVLESSRTPTMKLLRKNNQRPKVANYLCEIAPSQVFDWLLNTPPD